ncbi:GNAT family N-acetyltransferase [Chitinivorax sp. B]|uniref:GNAT family N-acetyltransferase n=1 Tax=Chitinivorax sp. B TaxID=2502235 RepID=UPI0010FA2C59|nr:GNAT family N-acetyltransferase [Chitinivorax sp. B]
MPTLHSQSADTLLLTVDFDNNDHARDFLALLDHYAHDPMGGGDGLSLYAKAHLVERLRTRTDFVGILAYRHGCAVGLINLIEGFSTFAARPLLNVHDVVVHESCRGQGIAQQLLEAAEQVAQTRGCCKLTLEVLEGNHGARLLYQRAGFEPYGLDPAMGQALFFEKKLNSEAPQAG